MPPEEVNVIAILGDGTEVMAYRKDGYWWVGVDDSPIDAKLYGVVSWRAAD